MDTSLIVNYLVAGSTWGFLLGLSIMLFGIGVHYAYKVLKIMIM